MLEEMNCLVLGQLSLAADGAAVTRTLVTSKTKAVLASMAAVVATEIWNKLILTIILKLIVKMVAAELVDDLAEQWRIVERIESQGQS